MPICPPQLRSLSPPGRCAVLILLVALYSALAGTAAAQSAYVEIRAGGPATLTNNVGGGITNNKAKGDPLGPAVMTINFGDVGPVNTASFVTATVPLRLRSNVPYILHMSVTGMTYGGGAPDAGSVALSDIGFGVLSAVRDQGGGVAPGLDIIVPSASGDPTAAANGSFNAVTGKYQYGAGHSLADYTTSQILVVGTRIMHAAVPTGSGRGLIVNTMFAVKPLYYTAGTFATSVVFTVASP